MCVCMCACDPTGGSPTLLRTLPLIFHALLTVRHSMARLLAALTLGKQADKWEGWLTAVAAANTQDSAPDKASQVRVCVCAYVFELDYCMELWGIVVRLCEGVCGLMCQDMCVCVYVCVNTQGALLRLPRPFASGYTLPVRVLWVTVMTTDAPASPGTASIAQGVGSALVHGKPKLQGETATSATHTHTYTYTHA